MKKLLAIFCSLFLAGCSFAYNYSYNGITMKPKCPIVYTINPQGAFQSDINNTHQVMAELSQISGIPVGFAGYTSEAVANPNPRDHWLFTYQYNYLMGEQDTASLLLLFILMVLILQPQ